MAASLSFDLDDEAAGFDSLAAEAGTVGGVGEGDAAATSFGSGVGVGAGACARAADAKVSPAAHSRAINLRVFIAFCPVGGWPRRGEFLFSSPWAALRACPRSAEGVGRGAHLPRPATAGCGRRVKA